MTTTTSLKRRRGRPVSSERDARETVAEIHMTSLAESGGAPAEGSSSGG